MSGQLQAGLIALIASVALGLLGWLLRQVYRGLLARLDQLEARLNSNQNRLEERMNRTDRELADLKAALPRLYVMRDDFIRTTLILENKFDDLARDIRRFIVCPQLHNPLPGERHERPAGEKPDPAR